MLHTARGWIGAAQFTDWVTAHNAAKIGEIDTASEIDFYHVAIYPEAASLKAVETAGTNKTPGSSPPLSRVMPTAEVEPIMLSSTHIRQSFLKRSTFTKKRCSTIQERARFSS